AHHVNQTPVPPRLRNPGISRELNDLILEMLSKSPEARPSSALAVASRFRELLETDRWSDGEDSSSAPTIAAPVATAPEVPSSRSRRPSSNLRPAASTAQVSAANRNASGSPLARRMLRDVEAEPVM